VSDAPHPPPGQDGRQQGIAAAITEVTERASLLIREEIELAKTEITEKATRLARGAVVAIAAGVFFFTALFFVLIGCAWLLYYELPIGNAFTFFWGFFAMALILVVLGVLAGLLAYRAVKAGAPPTPDMAIAEARKIRETVSSSGETPARTPFAPPPVSPVSPPPASAPAAASSQPSVESATAASSSPPPVPPAGPTSDTDLGRGTVDGTTLDS
jgi:predicted lipid-binding transport protein (Tim44 family)